MNKKTDILNIAKECFTNQSNAIANLEKQLNKDFVEVIDLIYKSKSRLVITGIGKSAIIGMKITATLNSTGTRAMFMHAADAIHGDLGMVAKRTLYYLFPKVEIPQRSKL